MRAWAVGCLGLVDSRPIVSGLDENEEELAELNAGVGVVLRHGHLAQHHHCRFCIHLRRSLDPPESCGEIP